jgi:large subunit ribosomal protein L23
MIINSAVKTEKSIQMMEFQNTVTFDVDLKATREMVKREVEAIFGVKVDSVRVKITPKGQKHAFVKLAEGHKAETIATKLKLA